MEQPPEVVRRPSELDEFFGKWVAVKGDSVIAAAESSQALAYELRKLGSRASGAVVSYVAEPSSAVMVGLG